jgi:dCMP deaminase
MNKEAKYNLMYMSVAELIAEMSYAVKKKVGAVIVKDNNIFSFGWNGMPAGFDNKCEIEIDGVLKTKDEVIHAEANAILKLSKSNAGAEGGTLYVTLSPCIECSKMILQSGITEVFYKEPYKNDKGIGLLIKAGVKVHQLS